MSPLSMRRIEGFDLKRLRFPAEDTRIAVGADSRSPEMARLTGDEIDDRAYVADEEAKRGGDDALVALIGRVASGEASALAQLYRRTSPRLFGLCLLILPAKADAEDALQEAFLAIWRRAASFDATRGTAIGWLTALTRNQAIDRLRATGRHTGAPLSLALQVADPARPAHDLLEVDEDARRLEACLDMLRDDDRTLVRTAFLDQVTYARLAAETGMPLGTVKTRIRRALLKLRECLR